MNYILAVCIILIIGIIMYIIMGDNVCILIITTVILLFINHTSYQSNITGGDAIVLNDKSYTNKPYIMFNDLQEKEAYVWGHRPANKGNHFGQRKLVITEIMFLSLKTEPNESYYVVYAGSAPSIKYPVLYELFKNCKFILVDPNPFGMWTTLISYEKLNSDNDILAQIQSSSSRTFIINEIMTIDIAKKLEPLSNKLFISDIRTNLLSDKPFDYDIALNNVQQIIWINYFKPKFYMLKYRPLYKLPEAEYYEKFIDIADKIPEWKEYNNRQENLDETSSYNKMQFIDKETKLAKALLVSGDIYLQCWAGGKSNECRIIGSNAKIVEEDPDAESKFYYYNMYLRNHPESHSLKYKDLMDENKYPLYPNNAQLYCGCNDCRIELHWIKKYVDKYNADINNVVELITKYTQSIKDHNIKNTTVTHKFTNNNSKKSYLKNR